METIIYEVLPMQESTTISKSFTTIIPVEGNVILSYRLFNSYRDFTIMVAV